MPGPIRNRIVAHRRLRAGDLVPHELNFRLHPEAQKVALQALYAEVGFARSLLAYELPDGRLKLIDGHLRRELDPDLEVDVEILDVDDAEARKLLLSMDPLAALAQTNAETHAALVARTKTQAQALKDLWQASARAADQAKKLLGKPAVQPGEPQFLILIECADEEQQLNLLEWLQAEGVRCRALLS